MRLGGAAPIGIVERLFWIDIEHALDVAACLAAAGGEAKRRRVTRRS